MYLALTLIFVLIIFVVVYAREPFDCFPKEFDPRRPDPGYENTPSGIGIYMNDKLTQCDPNFAKLPASQIGVNPFLDCTGKF